MSDKLVEVAISALAASGVIGYGLKVLTSWLNLQKKKFDLEASELEAKKIDKAIDEAVRATEEEGRKDMSLKSEDKENRAMTKARASNPEIGNMDEPILRQKIKATVNAKFNDRCE